MKKKSNIINDILNYFNNLRLSFSIKNLGYLPRWVVLLLDLSFVMFAGLITYMFLNGVDEKFFYVRSENFFFAIPFYAGVNVFFFWLFRTYSGIIRHSSYIDALKLFFSQSSVLAFFAIFNFIFLVSGYPKIYLNTGIFIQAILSFCLLFFLNS